MFSDSFEIPSSDSTFVTVQLPDLEPFECTLKGGTSSSTEQLDPLETAEYPIMRPLVHQHLMTPIEHQKLTKTSVPTSDASMSRPNTPKPFEHTGKPPLNKVQKRKRAEDSEAEILQMVATSLKEDEFSTWGRSIANDLGKVDRDQSIIAKK